MKQSISFGINTVQKLLQVCMVDVLQFHWSEAVILADMKFAVHTELGTVNLDARQFVCRHIAVFRFAHSADNRKKNEIIPLLLSFKNIPPDASDLEYRHAYRFATFAFL